MSASHGHLYTSLDGTSYCGPYYAVDAGGRPFLGKRLEKLLAVLRHVYAMAVVLVGWALFGGGGSGLWEELLPRLLLAAADFFERRGGLSARSYLPIWVILALGATRWLKRSGTGWERTRSRLAPVLVWRPWCCCTASLVDASYNPFL